MSFLKNMAVKPSLCAVLSLWYVQLYNVAGAIVWVVGLVLGGYFFGNIPVIRNHLNTIVLLGVCAAVVPVILGGLWKLFQRALRSN